MPTWGELQQELIEIRQRWAEGGDRGAESPADELRRKYLALLSERTERATILYYSGFQQHPQAPPNALAVSPADMTGFMEAVSNLEQRRLDLFLHSPGGNPDAVEQICEYLRTRFDHIRAIVPLTAMSAATMIALSADEIVMGAHSQLGPIDPQLTVPMPEGPRTSSAQAIKDQFALAVEQCQDPKNINAWMPILRSYAPGLLSACDHAAQRAKEIVTTALRDHMFAGTEDAERRAEQVAEWFGNAEEFLSHGRPVRRDAAREQGLEVTDLEADDDLQDAVLSVHHATLITMANWPISKLIENHTGLLWCIMGQQQLVVPATNPADPGPAPPGPTGPTGLPI